MFTFLPSALYRALCVTTVACFLLIPHALHASAMGTLSAAEEPVTANDPPESDIQPPQFSGQIFANYHWNTTNTGATENFNSFALKRWYSTVKAGLSEQLNFRGTTDVKHSDTGYSLIIKYAYLDWEITPGITLRGGIQQTGWQNYVNRVWGYRGIAKTMAQYQGHLSMADLGATVAATLPGQRGEVALGVLSGNGYRAVEANQFKDAVGRVRLTPFKSTGSAWAPLEVGGHAYLGSYTDGSDRHRWGGLVAYNGDALTLALNYDARKDGAVTAQGLSGFGTLRLGRVSGAGAFSLVGLVDVYSIDTSNGTDGQRVRSVTGLAYAPTNGVAVSLDYQHNWANESIYSRHDGVSTDADGSLFVHLIVTY